MQYMGGKSRLAKSIRDVILGDTDRRERYVEPFIGGGYTFSKLAPHFRSAVGRDAHEDLMLMWKGLQGGWTPPATLTKQEYLHLKTAAPSPIRGFAGFGCSFGGKWFGGFAKGSPGRDYALGSYRTLMRKWEELRDLDLTFEWGGFSEAGVTERDVVYCDPPYESSTGYSTGEFNHTAFWATARNWAETGAHVYVSEFNAPAEWECIWEKSRKVGLGEQSGARYEEKVDRLFTYRVG